MTVVLLIIIQRGCVEMREEKLLKNSKRSFGEITKILHGSSKNSKGMTFNYTVDGKKYDGYSWGDYELFEIGDTVLIEYAIANHSVARVVDKYYMKKYAYLKKIEK
jgi:hypothetical protein